MEEICRTCVCFPFCEVEPENCKRYINYTNNEIRKIDERILNAKYKHKV